jgi:hypothetical protein
MPAGDGISFKYGDYTLDPRPLFSVNKEFIKTPANTGLYSKYIVSLNGHILPTGIDLDDNKGGLGAVFNGITDLREAFEKDFKLLLLQCEDQGPIISGYPKVVNLDIQNADDNYVRRADYSINLELTSLTGTTSEDGGIACGDNSGGDLSEWGLVSVNEEYSIEFLDERVGSTGTTFFGGAEDPDINDKLPSVFSVQKTITAQGASMACEDGSYTEPWVRAKAYCLTNLAKQEWKDSAQDLICLSGLHVYNNFRNISVNALEGTATAAETYIVTNISSQYGLEDFEISCERGVDNPFTTVNIAGNIKGLIAISYDECGPIIPPAIAGGPSKFDRAIKQWSLVSGLLYSRAAKAFGNTPDNYPFQAASQLHVVPITQSLGYNPVGGIVTYNFSYDNRSLIYTGAISETISYSYNERPDLYASIAILGKSNGPLLQDLNTSGPKTTDISIDAFVQPYTGGGSLAGALDDVVVAYTKTVSAAKPSSDQVFLTADNRSWEPALGHFTWSKSWEEGKC